MTSSPASHRPPPGVREGRTGRYRGQRGRVGMEARRRVKGILRYVIECMYVYVYIETCTCAIWIVISYLYMYIDNVFVKVSQSTHDTLLLY